LTYAFDILSSVEANSLFDACKWLKLVNVISSAAGHKGMIEGQMLDMQNEGKLISLEELKTMHLLKTGALIQASVVAGGILGKGSAEQINSLNIYGKYVGLAFQVSDDILNVEGDPALLGKSVGTDAIKRKNTYPALIGLKESKIFANNLVNCALQALNQFDKKADLLRKIAVYIVERKN
jgi:geranylgeranyl diphosphate synthase type II